MICVIANAHRRSRTDSDNFMHVFSHYSSADPYLYKHSALQQIQHLHFQSDHAAPASIPPRNLCATHWTSVSRTYEFERSMRKRARHVPRGGCPVHRDDRVSSYGRLDGCKETLTTADVSARRQGRVGRRGEADRACICRERLWRCQTGCGCSHRSGCSRGGTRRVIWWSTG